MKHLSTFRKKSGREREREREREIVIKEKVKIWIVTVKFAS